MASDGDGAGNVHVAWRMAVAGQAAEGYAGNPGLAALAVAGSVGAGLADRFSDLELDCYWLRPPADEERLAPVRSLGGELTALWDYDQDDEEWSEDYGVGGLDITVSNFLVSSAGRFLDDVILRASTDPVRHMRLATFQRSRSLLGAELMASWRARAGTFPAGLVTVYLPHCQLKWQRHLIAGLGLVPERLAKRLEAMSSGPPEEGIRTAEALLAEVAALAEAHSGANISDFREALQERRQAIDPPLPESRPLPQNNPLCVPERLCGASWRW